MKLPRIATQRMTGSVNGARVHAWLVSTGRKGYRTPTGRYRVQRLVRTYRSRKYKLPMPYPLRGAPEKTFLDLAPCCHFAASGVGPAMTTSGRLGPAPYKLPTNLDEHAERRGSRLGFRLGPASSWRVLAHSRPLTNRELSLPRPRVHQVRPPANCCAFDGPH